MSENARLLPNAKQLPQANCLLLPRPRRLFECFADPARAGLPACCSQLNVPLRLSDQLARCHGSPGRSRKVFFLLPAEVKHRRGFSLWFARSPRALSTFVLRYFLSSKGPIPQIG